MCLNSFKHISHSLDGGEGVGDDEEDDDEGDDDGEVDDEEGDDDDDDGGVIWDGLATTSLDSDTGIVGWLSLFVH